MFQTHFEGLLSELFKQLEEKRKESTCSRVTVSTGKLDPASGVSALLGLLGRHGPYHVNHLPSRQFFNLRFRHPKLPQETLGVVQIQLPEISIRTSHGFLSRCLFGRLFFSRGLVGDLDVGRNLFRYLT